MQIEGFLKKVNLSSPYAAFALRDAIGINSNSIVEEWTITDIDKYLNGNPHVSGTEY